MMLVELISANWIKMVEVHLKLGQANEFLFSKSVTADLYVYFTLPWLYSWIYLWIIATWLIIILLALSGKNTMPCMFWRGNMYGLTSLPTPHPLQVHHSIFFKFYSYPSWQLYESIFLFSIYICESGCICYIHVMFCDIYRSCSEKCKKCPICRVSIEERMPVYDV